MIQTFLSQMQLMSILKSLYPTTLSALKYQPTSPRVLRIDATTLHRVIDWTM